MQGRPSEDFRPVLFLCDEYQAFATVGENDPTGDEKFFALSRQARWVPIIATHSIGSLRSTLSGETWRTLLQTFRTKIFLAVSDDFSARTEDLCGKEEQFKVAYSISESAQDAQVSLFAGRSTAHKSSARRSKDAEERKYRAVFGPNRLKPGLGGVRTVRIGARGLKHPSPPTWMPSRMRPTGHRPLSAYPRQKNISTSASTMTFRNGSGQTGRAIGHSGTMSRGRSCSCDKKARHQPLDNSAASASSAAISASRAAIAASASIFFCSSRISIHS